MRAIRLRRVRDKAQVREGHGGTWAATSVEVVIQIFLSDSQRGPGNSL